MTETRADGRPTALRPFTVRDAMALVAATGVGLAWARYGWTRTIHYQVILSTPAGGGAFGPAMVWVTRAPHVLLGATPCLAVWTITLFALQVFAARTRRRRLLARPGTAACGAASLALFWTASEALVRSAAYAIEIRSWSGFSNGGSALSGFGSYVNLTSAPCGLAVATAWAVLLSTGRCRPVRGWLDRVGLALGLAWLVWGGVALWAHYDLVFHPPSRWFVTPMGIILFG